MKQQNKYRALVLGGLLGVRLATDEDGVWWVLREDETQVVATKKQIQTWVELLAAPRLQFEAAVIEYATEGEEEAAEPRFTLLKGRGTEEGEL